MSSNNKNSNENRAATTGYFDNNTHQAAAVATEERAPSTVGVGKETLTVNQKQHLDDIMSFLNNTSNDASKFIKFAPNQTRILKVLTDKTEIVDVTFPSDPGHVVKRCRFTVYDMVADAVGGKLRPSSDTTKEFTTSTSLAKNIIQLNQKGFTTVEVMRTGEGLATKWIVTPVVE